MTQNPYNAASQKSEKDGQKAMFQVAKVDDVPDNSDGTGSNELVVQPRDSDSRILAKMLVPQYGDVNPPVRAAYQDIVGSWVVIGYVDGDKPVILGQLYLSDDDNVPNYVPGERVIGHPLSPANVRLTDEGWVVLQSGGVTNEGDGARMRITDDSVEIIDVEEPGPPDPSDKRVSIEMGNEKIEIKTQQITLSLDGDTVTIDADNVKLGSGSGDQPVARVGDSVDTDSGEITSGSSKVTAT